jgi:hypothetical protein
VKEDALVLTSHGKSLMMVLIVIVGCAPKVPILVPRSGDATITRFRRVAVMRFQGKAGDEMRNALEGAMLSRRIGDAPYFTVVSRDELDRVLKEQKVGVSGVVDDRTAAKIGKVLGVDALVLGQVNQYEAQDRGYTSTTTVGGKKKSRRSVSCTDRTARIDVHVKFVDTATGAVAASHNVKGEKSDSACEGPPKDRDTLLMEAREDMFRRFADSVVPGMTRVIRELRTHDDDSGVFGSAPVDQQLSRGATYATNGNWELAREAWEEAVRVAPSSAAAHYDVGVAYEQQGLLDKAREHYDLAARLRPDPVYVRATAEVRGAQGARDTMGDRGDSDRGNGPVRKFRDVMDSLR